MVHAEHPDMTCPDCGRLLTYLRSVGPMEWYRFSDTSSRYRHRTTTGVSRVENGSC